MGGGLPMQAIENNRRVMETNEEMVSFNQLYIDENAQWLKRGLHVQASLALGVARRELQPLEVDEDARHLADLAQVARHALEHRRVKGVLVWPWLAQPGVGALP